MLASLADPSRYRVLSVLAEGDYCVSELAARIGLSQSCTTRHLQTLQRAGILSRTRAGKRVLFRIREGDPELARVLELLVFERPPVGHPRPASAASSASARTRAGRGKGLRAALAGAASTGGDPADAVTIPATAGGAVISDRPVVKDSPTDTADLEAALDEAPAGAAVELEDFLL